MAFALPAALMVPISAGLVQEPRGAGKATPSGWEYIFLCWDLLKSKACFYIILYYFLSGAIGTIMTPAQGYVKRYWAGVQNLQNQLFSLVGLLAFAGGAYHGKKPFLEYE